MSTKATRPTSGPWEMRIGTGPFSGLSDIIAPSGVIAFQIKRRPNVELMIAACNACQQINPTNPIAVAEALPAIVEALQTLISNVDHGSLMVSHDDRRATDVDVQRARAALAQLERQA